MSYTLAPQKMTLWSYRSWIKVIISIFISSCSTVQLMIGPNIDGGSTHRCITLSSAELSNIEQNYAIRSSSHILLRYLENKLVRSSVLHVAADSGDRVIEGLSVFHFQSLRSGHHVSKLTGGTVGGKGCGGLASVICLCW